MAKERALGAAIFAICIIVLILYIVELGMMAFTGFHESLLKMFLASFGRELDPFHEFLWLVAVPVAIALCAVLVIFAWIGWTMATTPPPLPAPEHLEEELEEEEEEEEEAEGS